VRVAHVKVIDVIGRRAARRQAEASDHYARWCHDGRVPASCGRRRRLKVRRCRPFEGGSVQEGNKCSGVGGREEGSRINGRSAVKNAAGIRQARQCREYSHEILSWVSHHGVANASGRDVARSDLAGPSGIDVPDSNGREIDHTALCGLSTGEDDAPIRQSGSGIVCHCKFCSCESRRKASRQRVGRVREWRGENVRCGVGKCARC
jgi:hypothetical protein